MFSELAGGGLDVGAPGRFYISLYRLHPPPPPKKKINKINK